MWSFGIFSDNHRKAMKTDIWPPEQEISTWQGFFYLAEWKSFLAIQPISGTGRSSLFTATPSTPTCSPWVPHRVEGPAWITHCRLIPKITYPNSGKIYGYGSIPINTIFRGMNIHLPAILMFTRGTRFWPIPILQMGKNMTCSVILQRQIGEEWHQTTWLNIFSAEFYLAG